MLILALVQIVLRLGQDPDRSPLIEYPRAIVSMSYNVNGSAFATGEIKKINVLFTIAT